MDDGAKARLESPVGPITLIERDGAIVELEWNSSGDVAGTGVLSQAVTQLHEYFAGNRRQFDLPLKPRGSGFQQKFYAALCAIPYGETRTYGDLAAELGVSAQAIGQACGANPIAILIPCHRVLGASGLGGFSGAGGVEAKVELLKLEGAASLLI
ncbi:methylated-DNA--[protein]-cysteine S-methyltransferase [Litoreibacter janthinus]|uniref:Methylated-DNA--protein-cysteine methyltransferase n=1 Tax=Litoreibacter janthinus TaxID=670154 RepID=A0A1I6HVZ0_9RHOB|nr:methylated-DNA--[protein]-cysteine S-methyltransferase [Litoreibacter janthinus]SFR58611.1 methylated-DNA-[protein]-cysteine S-methyltransferase [Litoreibacter janthinus]